MDQEGTGFQKGKCLGMSKCFKEVKDEQIEVVAFQFITQKLLGDQVPISLLNPELV